MTEAAKGTLSGDLDEARGTLSGDLDEARGTLSGDLEPGAGAGAGAGTGTDALGEVDLDVEREVGRGGMGVVWLARQRSLDRPVAVKTLKSELASGPAAEKFAAEALVTGRLEHPSIPPVHLYGHDANGRPFLCMKLVKGVEWAKLLEPETDEEKARAAGMDRRAHLEILERVCEAMAFAHSRGVIHRDLKPENVMVGEFGEVQVMDWGIALDRSSGGASSTSTSTKPRAAVGTPAYMAPEMAAADEAKQGPWTDVYLLGGILYEILTGTPPHRGENVMQVLLAAQAGEIERPEERALRLRSGQAPGREIPEMLAEIAMKALAPDPARRYQDAREFERAIEDYLRNEASLKIAKAALAELDAVEGDIAAGEKPPAEIYPALAACVAKLKEAEDLWSGNRAAREGLARARLAYAGYAIERGDLNLAEAQLAAAPADDARAEGLRRRVAEIRVARVRRRRLLAAALSLLAGLVLLGVWIGWQQYDARKRRALAIGETDGVYFLAPTERIAVYESAIEIDPTWPEGHSNLARAHIDRSFSRYVTDPAGCAADLAAALPAYDRAIALDPGGATARIERAYTHEMRGDWPRARADYVWCAEVAPGSPEGFSSAAIIALSERRFEDAEREATRSVEVEPGSEAHSVRGLARFCLGRPEEALADFERAKELYEKEDDWLYAAAALAYLGLGREREAALQLVGAIRFQPRSPYALALLAYLAARRGDLERALALATRAREARAIFAEALLAPEPRWRAPSFAKPPLDEVGRALGLEVDLATLVPAEVPRSLALRRRGEAAFARGEPEAALALAKRALAEDPADGSARLLRARCLVALGHGPESVADLELAEVLAPNRAGEARALLERVRGGEGR